MHNYVRGTAIFQRNAAVDPNDPTEEQKAKASACKTPQELVALAMEEGVELADEQMEAISGGSEWYELAPGSPDDFRPIPGG